MALGRAREQTGEGGAVVTAAAAVLDAAVSEREFQAAVVQAARLYGWVIGCTWDSRHSPYGEPDLRLLRPPRLIWAELKTMTGQPTGEQYEWLEQGRSVPGLECYLWRPNDWDLIVRVLA